MESINFREVHLADPQPCEKSLNSETVRDLIKDLGIKGGAWKEFTYLRRGSPEIWPLLLRALHQAIICEQS